MDSPLDGTTAPDPTAPDSMMATLLELTGDLDKAQVLQGTLPTWLTGASSQVRQALLNSYEAGQPARDTAARLLERVIPLRQFCRDRLQALLVAKGLADLNVERDLLQVPRVYFLTGGLLDGPHVEMEPAQNDTLLHAAMQTVASVSLPPGSVIRRASDQSVVKALSAQAFVDACRELDVGGAYQQHLRVVFNLPAPDEPVNAELDYNPTIAAIGPAMCMNMLVDLHIAFAKGDVGQAAYAALQTLIDADRPANRLTHVRFNGQPLRWQGIAAHHANLWGVLVFSQAGAEDFSTGPVLVYMPGDPLRPWFEYPSLEDFTTYLSLKLQVPEYRRFFTRYLDESQRFDFFQHIDQDKTLGRVEPMPVTANLSWFFFTALVCKLQRDAEVLAVPVPSADQEQQRRRLQDYLNAGLTVLGLAGLVVPVLGQLMTGVAIGQLLGEVFEGIDDWTHGEKTEAFGHLVNVAENLAGMALFAAGVKAVSKVVQTTRIGATRFFDKMEAIEQQGVGPRLWRRRLGTYRQSLDVDAQTSANTRGIYQVNGQSYVKIDGALYSIAYDAPSGHWRVRHPLRDSAYRPPLSHNFQGGWRFAFERPDDWDDAYRLLIRLDPSLATLPPEHVRSVASITGLDVPRLRLHFRQNLALPKRFRDGIVRVQQNQKVRDLIWQLEHQPRPDADTAPTQLLALPLMSGWPKGRFFEVLDSEGYLIERYPDTAPFDYEDLSIHITEQQLHEGEVMSTVLDALEPEEVQTLLGAEVAPQARQATLARQLLASLARTHRPLYEQLYEQTEAQVDTHYGVLKSHYPALPNRVAWELLSDSPTTQRWRLRDSRRVPLGLAQRTRAALQDLEQDQALFGLLLPELANENTQRLAVGLLRRVPGWPGELSVQLREGSFSGRVLGESSAEAATVRRVVVKSEQGFQAFDEQGRAVGEIASGHEGIYQALLDTLSPDQRRDLSVTGRANSGYLRYALMTEAETRRPRLSRYLYPERAVPEPPVLCTVAAQINPAQHPRALVAKVRHLYPLFSDAQIAAFLDEQGADPLSRARAVQALEQEFDALHRALKAWRRDKTSLAGLPRPIDDYRMSRHYTMRRIEDAWKQMTRQPDAEGVRVLALNLDGMEVGPLPTLPAEVSFAAIRKLSLNHMGLNDDVAYFLKHFPGVQTLELQGNRISRLPEALSRMPQLKRLYLDNNRLQLTQYTRTKLAGFSDLEVLGLNDNPLVDPPPISRLFSLRALFMRNCRLKELPGGLARLPYLEYLDLRENDISSLPPWVFELPSRVARTLNLRQNPLDTPSHRLLGDYRKRTGIGMGILEDNIARMNEQKARDLWLQDSGADFPIREATWAALKNEPRSEGLFKLLTEVGGTADATQVREDMRRRVWRVLEAAAANENLRDEIFDRAATPINCDDAAAVNFASLEVLVEVHIAAESVEGGVLTAKPLLRLGQGLFRLDRLEQYAKRHSDQNPAADPLEVSLAFRTGLADRFYLPGQPRHMRYARLGGVTPQDMTSAAFELRSAELSPALVNYLVELPLWVRYLKKTYRDRFERLYEPFDQRMNALFEQVDTLEYADYSRQVNLLMVEQAAAEKAELNGLTEEALKNDAQGLCEAPVP